ncbi:XdhC family protein, partial [Delftia acidovorans]
CIEDDLIARYSHASDADALSDGAPRLLRYGVSADEAHRFGLPCGGTLELLLEFNPDAAALQQLVQWLDEGRMVRRTVDKATGQVVQQVSDAPEPLVHDGQQVANSFGPEYRMLLIGAGQLSEYLATMALFNGFAVTVCDPREEYSRHWSVAGVQLSREMPDDLVRTMRADARTCIIGLTHDPKLDDLALMEALESPAFYVGAIGSRRNTALRLQRLSEHFGLGDAQLARLRGPIGLYIGSKTPPEIAVSIMAEVLAAKNGVALPRGMTVEEGKLAAAQPPQPLEDDGPEGITPLVCGVG